MVRDLKDPEVALCGKNKEAALEAKAKGNECFSKGDYSNALHFYSQVQMESTYLLTGFYLYWISRRSNAVLTSRLIDFPAVMFWETVALLD